MIRATAGLRQNLSLVASEKPFPSRRLAYSTRSQVYTCCQDVRRKTEKDPEAKAAEPVAHKPFPAFFYTTEDVFSLKRKDSRPKSSAKVCPPPW